MSVVYMAKYKEAATSSRTIQPRDQVKSRPGSEPERKDLLCSVSRHFFVVAISPSLDTLETSLCLFGEAKGPGMLFSKAIRALAKTPL